MKRIIRYLLLLTPFCIIECGCLHLQKEKDVLFQTSTITALLEGVFEGDITYKEVKRHGDFGIGTFNSLDGEMIGLEGRFYQIKADGLAYPFDDYMKTPFASVTFFEPDKTLLLNRHMDIEQLKQYLDNLLPTKNIFYAIKIEGIFEYIKARSVPCQKKPYPQVSEILKNQPIFEFQDVKGIMLGFRIPWYMKGIIVTDYHFHFITGDKKVGGHILEARLKDVKVEIDYTTELHLVLSKTDEFYKANLGENKPLDINMGVENMGQLSGDKKE